MSTRFRMMMLAAIEAGERKSSNSRKPDNKQPIFVEKDAIQENASAAPKTLMELKEENRLRLIRMQQQMPIIEEEDDDDDYYDDYSDYSGSYARDVAELNDVFIDDALDGEPDAYWNID